MASRHKITNTEANIEMKVSKSLSDEIIISYKDLVELKVIEPNFPMWEMQKGEQKKGKLRTQDNG